MRSGPKLCECGCGEPAPIIKSTDTSRGYVKGEPHRFVAGHSIRHPLAERFWSKVDRDGGPDCCWPWLAARANGYGKFYVDGRMVRAHRFAYELLVGPIPEGLVLDHLCAVTFCVNPAHLEPVTQRENARRGDAGK